MCVLANCLDTYVYTSVSILFLCPDRISSTCESCKRVPRREGGVLSMRRPALVGALDLSPRFQGYGSQFSLNTPKADSGHTEQTDSTHSTAWQRRVSFFPVPLSQSTSPLCLKGKHNRTASICIAAQEIELVMTWLPKHRGHIPFFTPWRKSKYRNKDKTSQWRHSSKKFFGPGKLLLVLFVCLVTWTNQSNEHIAMCADYDIGLMSSAFLGWSRIWVLFSDVCTYIIIKCVLVISVEILKASEPRKKVKF